MNSFTGSPNAYMLIDAPAELGGFLESFDAGKTWIHTALNWAELNDERFGSLPSVPQKSQDQLDFEEFMAIEDEPQQPFGQPYVNGFTPEQAMAEWQKLNKEAFNASAGVRVRKGYYPLSGSAIARLAANAQVIYK